MSALVRRALLALLAASWVVSSAGAWPDKPIRIIVPGQAAGSFDIIVRMLGEELRPLLGNTQVVVDNRPGESGSVAVAALLAAQDDHTFLIMSDDLLTYSLASRSAKYQPLRDFKMVSAIGEGGTVFLAGSKAPFKTFAELVTYARANPGRLSYSSVGKGSVGNLTAELVWKAQKVEIKHVDSRGAGGVVNDLIDGAREIAVVGIGPATRAVHSDKITALAVSSSARVAELPETPTLTELGLTGLTIINSGGIVAPVRTPDAVVDQLAKAIAAALADEGFRKRFAEHGATARPSTPAAYTAELQESSRRWKALIDEHGLAFD